MKIKLVDVVVGLAIAGFLASIVYAMHSVKVAQRERNEVYCIEGIAYNRIDGGYLEVTPARRCIVETK